jgi:ribosomal protein L37AE/L43A
MASERDPHDIAPPGFFDEYDGLEDASRRMASKTDKADLTRCPECAMADISIKSDPLRSDCVHRRPGRWRCNICGAHFDDPAPSANDEDVPRCPVGSYCQRTRVRRRPGDKDFYCHHCGQSFDAESTEGEE